MLRFRSAQTRRLSDTSDKPQKRVDLGSTVREVLGCDPPKGKVLLLAAEPGAGKSTLMLQSLINCPVPSLLICTEEEFADVADRARRVGRGVVPDTVSVAQERRVYKMASLLRHYKYAVIDSLNETEVESSEPLVSCTRILIHAAQKSGCFVVLIAHINKDGDVSGPAKVEHLVDVVGMIRVNKEKHDERTLFLKKNRIGRSGQTSVMTMGAEGLTLKESPSDG